MKIELHKLITDRTAVHKYNLKSKMEYKMGMETRTVSVNTEKKMSGKIVDTNGKDFYKETMQSIATVCKYTLGRTLNLGSYNFARITVSIETSGDLDVTKSTTEEILKREIASITGIDHNNTSVDDQGILAISIEYGLTISLKKYESARIDILSRKTVSKNEKAENVLTALQTDLAEHLMIEKSRFENLKSATDFGI